MATSWQSSSHSKESFLFSDFYRAAFSLIIDRPTSFTGEVLEAILLVRPHLRKISTHDNGLQYQRWKRYASSLVADSSFRILYPEEDEMVENPDMIETSTLDNITHGSNIFSIGEVAINMLEDFSKVESFDTRLLLQEESKKGSLVYLFSYSINIPEVFTGKLLSLDLLINTIPPKPTKSTCISIESDLYNILDEHWTAKPIPQPVAVQANLQIDLPFRVSSISKPVPFGASQTLVNIFIENIHPHRIMRIHSLHFHLDATEISGNLTEGIMKNRMEETIKVLPQNLGTGGNILSTLDISNAFDISWISSFLDLGPLEIKPMHKQSFVMRISASNEFFMQLLLQRNLERNLLTPISIEWGFDHSEVLESEFPVSKGMHMLVHSVKWSISQLAHSKAIIRISGTPKAIYGRPYKINVLIRNTSLELKKFSLISYKATDKLISGEEGGSTIVSLNPEIPLGTLPPGGETWVNCSFLPLRTGLVDLPGLRLKEHCKDGTLILHPHAQHQVFVEVDSTE